MQMKAPCLNHCASRRLTQKKKADALASAFSFTAIAPALRHRVSYHFRCALTNLVISNIDT
jgi:hypothetical protein